RRALKLPIEIQLRVDADCPSRSKDLFDARNGRTDVTRSTTRIGQKLEPPDHTVGRRRRTGGLKMPSRDVGGHHFRAYEACEFITVKARQRTCDNHREIDVGVGFRNWLALTGCGGR